MKDPEKDEGKFIFHSTYQRKNKKAEFDTMTVMSHEFILIRNLSQPLRAILLTRWLPAPQ